MRSHSEKLGVSRERIRELDLYSKYASDNEFKVGLHEALIRKIELSLTSKFAMGNKERMAEVWLADLINLISL